MADGDLDDGDPYTAAPGGGDRAGGTRTQRGHIPMGVPLKPFPKGEGMRLGSAGRASINVDRPVQPTALPYNPLTHTGPLPTSFTSDPRGHIGSDTSLQPEFNIMSKLNSVGADPSMAVWIKMRISRGQYVSIEMLKKFAALAHFGDALAGQLLNYANGMNRWLQGEIARQQAQQAGARRAAGF